jgi:hypothetical protein
MKKIMDEILDLRRMMQGDGDDVTSREMGVLFC